MPRRESCGESLLSVDSWRESSLTVAGHDEVSNLLLAALSFSARTRNRADSHFFSPHPSFVIKWHVILDQLL